MAVSENVGRASRDDPVHLPEERSHRFLASHPHLPSEDMQPYRDAARPRSDHREQPGLGGDGLNGDERRPREKPDEDKQADQILQWGNFPAYRNVDEVDAGSNG